MDSRLNRGQRQLDVEWIFEESSIDFAIDPSKMEKEELINFLLPMLDNARVPSDGKGIEESWARSKVVLEVILELALRNEEIDSEGKSAAVKHFDNLHKTVTGGGVMTTSNNPTIIPDHASLHPGIDPVAGSPYDTTRVIVAGLEQDLSNKTKQRTHVIITLKELAQTDCLYICGDYNETV